LDARAAAELCREIGDREGEVSAINDPGSSPAELALPARPQPEWRRPRGDRGTGEQTAST